MVRFVDDVFVSDNLRSKTGSIKWKTVCGVGLVNVSFITLSDNGKDIFDIYPGMVFKQRAVRRSNMVILGIASNGENATELVETMINNAIASTGDAGQIRSYYEKYISEHL